MKTSKLQSLRTARKALSVRDYTRAFLPFATEGVSPMHLLTTIGSLARRLNERKTIMPQLSVLLFDLLCLAELKHVNVPISIEEMDRHIDRNLDVSMHKIISIMVMCMSNLLRVYYSPSDTDSPDETGIWIRNLFNYTALLCIKRGHDPLISGLDVLLQRLQNAS